ncbi:hypothetical protein ACLB2K_039371 [Fragaria x ananassa]
MIQAFRDNKVSLNQITKFEIDFEIIMSRYNNEENKFVFRENKLEINVDDVHSLFHITKDGRDLDLEQKSKKGEKKIMLDSKIFGKHKGPITRPKIENALLRELGKKKKSDPGKIASLVIMYLLSVFFFSKTGNQLDWTLILTCEDLDNINGYNWSKRVLQSLKEGLKKHNKA